MQRLEVSGAVRPIYGSLGVKGLRTTRFACLSPPPRVYSDQGHKSHLCHVTDLKFSLF
jgi:hypothetical protein